MHIAPLLLLILDAVALGAVSVQRNEGRLSRSVKTFVPDWYHHSKLRSNELQWKNHSVHGKNYGQDYEDIIATNRYFHDMHNGTYLELGAHDGSFCSNTRLFEDTRGWCGLLIEPNPEEYEKIAGVRPNAISVNAAICDRKQDVHFISRLSHDGVLESAGAVGGIWEFMSPAFRKQWYGSEESIPEGAVRTSCLPLQSILKHFGITHIDFFSLDVEGAELEVLKTLDLSAVHINVIVVEQDGTNREKDEGVRKLLLANKFDLDRDISTGSERMHSRNDWFVNKDFEPFEAPVEHVWLAEG